MVVGFYLKVETGGKSELHRTQCSVTRSPGNGKESATENIPSRLLLVKQEDYGVIRVKRWGQLLT